MSKKKPVRFKANPTTAWKRKKREVAGIRISKSLSVSN